MRKLILSTLIVALSLTANAQWIQQTSGTAEDLSAVAFSDNFNGVAVGNNGVILKTTDGGNTWIQQVSGTTEWLRTLEYVNGGIYYAAGNNGTLLKSIDYGSNWSIINLSTTKPINDIKFIDVNNGYGVGGKAINGELIIKTTDGGISWQESDSIPPNLPSYQKVLYAIGVYDINKLLIGGGENFAKYIYKTSNTGNSFTPAATLPSGFSPITAIQYTSQNIVYATIQGTNPIIKSTDGGANWTTSYTTSNTSLLDLSFIDDNNGFACGYGPNSTEAIITSTSDGGTNWTVITLNQTAGFLIGIDFPSLSTGYAVGENGQIYKYFNSTTSLTETNNIASVSIFPNPSNGIFSITAEEKIEKITIYSVSGKLVKTITTNFSKIDLSNDSKGIYFIKIYNKNGEEVSVVKVIKK